MSNPTTAATDGTGNPASTCPAGHAAETVTVRYLIAGTVVEETWTAERITVQHRRGEPSLINLWRGGRRVEQVSYRTAERIHRVLAADVETYDPREAP